MIPISLIKCPVCGADFRLTENRRSLACLGAVRHHCFDVSHAGYLNLVVGHASGGDGKEAVRARSSFLEKGYYAPVSDEINALLWEIGNVGEKSVLVDAGCGEGYYMNRAVERLGCTALGFDLSKFAVEHGARAAERLNLSDKVFYGVSSVFEMPLPDACADAITNIFAPCAPTEYARVLKPGGILLVAGAGAEHLFGLKRAVYDEPYRNEMRADLPKNLPLAAHKKVSYSMHVSDNADIAHLFSMTPYYYRTNEMGFARLAALCELDTEVDVDIFVYRKPGAKNA